MLGFLKKIYSKPETREIVSLAIGVFVFGFFFLFPPPPSLSRILFKPDWQVLILIFLFSTLLFRTKGRGWETIKVIFVLILFAFPLIYKWQFAKYDGNLIAGLLPWNDANSYFGNAHLLSAGMDFNVLGTRRPLFAGFLSVILRLSGGDFMTTLVLLTLINALSVYLIIRVVKNLYGTPAASVFLILSYTFYGTFAGKTLTEQLGFSLGILSLYFLLVGVQSKNFWRALFGLGILTLALNARAGAFFILPLLCLWLGYFFRHNKSFLRIIGLAFAVVIIGFVINFAHVKILGAKDGIAFSNYSYTLYGLASGNKGWTHIYVDYPIVLETEVMSLAIQKIRSDPILFLTGMLLSLNDYFNPGSGAFSFLSWFIDRKINAFIWGFVIIGLIYSWRKRREGSAGLILVSFLGVLASLPLLPPIDADSMRAFAATVPFTALWVAAGVSGLVVYASSFFHLRLSSKNIEIEGPLFRIALSFSIPFLILIIFGPFMSQAFPMWSSPTINDEAQNLCPSGQKPLQGHKFYHTGVTLIPNNAATESYMPFIRIADFQENIKNSRDSYSSLSKGLLDLKTGDQLFFSLITTLSPGGYFISRSPINEPDFIACASFAENQSLQKLIFPYLGGSNISPLSLTFSQENHNLTLFIRVLYGIAIIVLFISLLYDILCLKLNLLAIIIILTLCLPSIFIGLYTQGKLLIPALQERIVLNMKDARLENGDNYFLHLNIDWKGQEKLNNDSPAIIYENGVPLAFQNSDHQDISEKSGGHYSVKGNHLVFSSSDNTDPRINSRVYVLEIPRPISKLFQLFVYSFTILGIIFFFIAQKYYYHRDIHD